MVAALLLGLLVLLLRNIAVVPEQLHEERSIVVLELALKGVSAAVAHCKSL